MLVTVLSITTAGLIMALVFLLVAIGKVKKDLEILYLVAHSKLDKNEFTAKAMPFGYMCGARDAFLKLKEYF